MQFNKEQYETFEALKRFVTSTDGQIFIIKGYAGTGKTTMIKQLTDLIKVSRQEFRLMAPTGRAASILRKKTDCNATTIHRGIYDFRDIEILISKEDISKSSYKIRYPFLVTSSPQICIVDESSMITNHVSTNELWEFGTECLLNDLLSFTFRHKQGKLILLGDPAQLPPVGEAQTEAFNEEMLRERGFSVETHILTEVMRQDKDSSILTNSMRIREAYTTDTYNQLQIEYGTDVHKLPQEQLIETYLQHFPEPRLGNSVVISYSNAHANLYNRDIRHRMYGEYTQYPRVGDIIMVVSNHYDSNTEVDHEPMDIMNGESAQIIETGNIEKQSAPVWDGSERKIVEIEFMQTSLLLSDGNIWRGKIIVNPLLNDELRNLSVTHLKALFINFCMRHPELDDKKDHAAFIEAYRQDEYVSALRVKYGYAITCHKSQGGEWDTVFVNADGIYVNPFGLRWLYTALTRARKTLYCVNIPSITPISKLRITEINKASHCCSEYPAPLSDSSSIDSSPFHSSDAPEFVIAKYQHIKHQFIGSGYTIADIKSYPYRERYSIVLPDGCTTTIDMMYNGKGVFRPIACADERLQSLLNATQEQKSEYSPLLYEPTTNAAQFLYDLMVQACANADAKIVGVSEDLAQYRIVYCLQTSGQYAWLNIFVTAKGMISYIAPYSDIQDDEKLIKLLNYLCEIKV